MAPTTRFAPASTTITTLSWEQRWEQLSDLARSQLLHRCFDFLTTSYANSNPSCPSYAFLPAALRELTQAGFVETQQSRASYEVVVVLRPEANAFVRWLSFLGGQCTAPGFVLNRSVIHGLFCALANDRKGLLKQIASASRFGDTDLEPIVLEYVVNYRWPEKVVETSGHGCAGEILETFYRIDSPVPYKDVERVFPHIPPTELYAALAKLRQGLALFDLLDPKTYRLHVFVLRQVRASLAAAQLRPRQRPALPVVEPLQQATDAGTLIPDLRTYLLELLRQPAKLKQDGELQKKETDRLLGLLEPAPDWLAAAPVGERTRRLRRMMQCAIALELVGDDVNTERSHLRVTPQGRQWLQQSALAQYEAVALRYRTHKDWQFSFDSYFLGSICVVVQGKKRSTLPIPSYYDKHDAEPLRTALANALTALAWDRWYPLEDLLAWVTYGVHNPFYLGRPASEIKLWHDDRPVSSFPEEFEAVTAAVLRTFILERLIPFGAMQVGRLPNDAICVARGPLLELFFGRPPKRELGFLAANTTTRVVVQPDFTVLVMGVDSAPAAELAPICERIPGRVSQGALHLQLTRAAVVRAASTGMTAAAILAILEKHSSVPIPKNVRSEIVEWAGSVRTLSVMECTVIHCSDAATAERVCAVLGKLAQRLGTKDVALPKAKYSRALREKLQSQGLLVPVPAEAESKRTWRY